MRVDGPPQDELADEGWAERRRKRRVMLVAVLSIAVTLAVGIYYGFSQSVAPPSWVTIEGMVTVSSGYTPLAVVFAGGGLSYTSQVTNGTYSVRLPNNQAYNITVNVVNEQTHRGGTCYLGLIALASETTVYVLNIRDC